MQRERGKQNPNYVYASSLSFKVDFKCYRRKQTRNAKIKNQIA